MKKRDNQKMNMYTAVLQICKDEHDSWENIPGFVAAVGELESRLDELHQLHTKRDEAILGVSASKYAFIDDLVEHLFAISKALGAKGMLAKNKGLIVRNKVSLSALKVMSANGLLHRINGLQSDLETYGDSLPDYGITAAYITETQALMAEAPITLFQTRKAVIGRKELTKSVMTNTRLIDEWITGQLDALIVSFKSSLPSFYNRYKSARLIIDYGHGSKTPPEPDDGVS